MAEFGENDNQKSFSEFQRELADRRRRAHPARGRLALRALRILVPPWFPIVVGQAANMAAVKSNELSKGAQARISVGRPVSLASNAFTHRFQRSLPEQAIDERRRRRMVDHEPVVSRQRHAELAQVRKVGQTLA